MPKRSRSGEVKRSRARRGADQGEGRQIQLDRPRAGTFADHDVELKVLHRRIQNLLHDRAQPMNLVDEQHIVRLQIRQQRRKIACAFDHRARGLPQIDAEFIGDDVRQRRLAEAGRSEDQHMVERLAPPARRFDEDLHLRLDRRLPHIVGEPFRTHGAIESFLIALDAGGNDAVLFDHCSLARLSAPLGLGAGGWRLEARVNVRARLGEHACEATESIGGSLYLQPPAPGLQPYSTCSSISPLQTAAPAG